MAPACKCEISGPCCTKWMKTNLLLILTVIAMCVGIGLGVGLRYRSWTKDEIAYLQFPGDLLLRMLGMLIIPLVVTSLISGLASLDARATGSMGWRAVLYYLGTTISAVILGIVLVVTIRPGVAGTPDMTGKEKIARTADTMLDLIKNIFPDNLITACFQKVKTVGTLNEARAAAAQAALIEANATFAPNVTRSAINISNYDFETGTTGGTNVLGLLVFSIVFEIIISKMGEETRILIKFFDALNAAIMKLTGIVIWYSPIGIIFLVAAKIVSMDDVEEVVRQLGLYTATVLAGLAIHGLIILPILYLILVRKNPIRHFVGTLQALLTAVATSSSSATLPVTIKCLEDKVGIDRRVTRFVLPIGATINMDGTALYEAVAVIFIAQVYGKWPLDFGQIIIISLTATLASIGAAGIPQAGLVTMVMALQAVGLPIEGIRLIIVIDWFLDRFRTSVNVWGDSIGAAVVERFTKAQFEKLDSEGLVEGVEAGPPSLTEKDGVDNANFQHSDADNKPSQDGGENTQL